MRIELPLSARVCFWAAFSVNLVAGILVQMLLPYLFPSGHIEKGLFVGDSAMIQEFAVKFALKLDHHGWNLCDLLSESSLLVPFLGALYHLTGLSEPWIVLPIQAALQGGCAWLVFVIGRRLQFSKLASAMGALFLAIHPQVFEWSTQLGKDGFFLFGNLLVLSGILGLRLFPCLAQILGGCLFVYIARPSWSEILLWQGGLTFLFQLASAEAGKRFQAALPAAILGSAGFVLMNLYSWIPASTGFVAPPRQNLSDEFFSNMAQVQNKVAGEEAITWQTSKQLSGTWVEKMGVRIFLVRRTYLIIGGRSLVDKTTYLNSLEEQVGYFPRALQVALFAPFPWGGPDKISPPDPRLPPSGWKQNYAGQETMKKARLIMMPVMALAYVCFGCLVFWMFGKSAVCLRPFFLVALFCLPVLALIGTLIPNLGILVRVRFTHWAMLVALGVMSAFMMLEQYFKLMHPLKTTPKDAKPKN